MAFLDDDDASVPTRVVRQYQRIVGYEAKHPGATILCYSNRDVVEAGNQSPSMRLLGIGRVPVEPFGPQVADYVLGLLQDYCRCVPEESQTDEQRRAPEMFA